MYPLIDFKTVISRSSYSRGARCKKSLWLHRNRAKDTRNLPSDSKLIKLASNQLVDCAGELFNSTPYLCARLSLEEDKDWNASVLATTAAIKSGESVLANPSFYANDLMCDIHYLEKTKSGSWNAFVVKSSTKISDKSKEKAAFQLHTIQSAGLKINGFFFLTINNKYERGDQLDLKKMFRKRDIFAELNAQLPTLKKTVTELRKTLATEKAPDIEIGEYCVSPYSCEFKSNCWKHVPKDSVFNLRRVSRETKFKWWNNGVKTVAQLQGSKFQAGIALSDSQSEEIIDKPHLLEFLRRVNHPILFLDFEGYLPALPPYKGIRPFQIIPFLFAAYRIDSVGSESTFHSFIGDPAKDSRKEFATQLIELCSEIETILVYDPLTEKQVIQGLMRAFPEMKDDLESILHKIVDLAKPITNKHFYLPAMKGLSSMKRVLPAVAPNTNYKNLEVQSGRAASQLYQILCDENHDRDTARELDNLVEYCKMDVYGLVLVYNAIRAAIDDPVNPAIPS